MKKINTQPKICFFGTYDKTYTSNRLVLQGLRANGIDVVEVNAHIKVTTMNKKSEITWWKLFLRVIKKYRLVIETIKHARGIASCDVIYVGYPGHFDVLPAWIVAKIYGKKLVFNPLLIFYTGFTEEQGILSKSSIMAKLAKWLESLIYSMVDQVYADTAFQKDFFIKVLNVPEAKIRILPIGADDQVYAYTPYTNAAKKLEVTYYGLYSPIHGVPYLIEAAHKLLKDKNIHFVFVGNGQAFQVNYDRAKKLKLTNCTFYHDVPESDHIGIIQKADVFLGFLEKHPSVDRIIPNKVYQGLSLGKVVLTADAPVIRSVFAHNKNIYTVKPANVNSLIQTIKDLKNNPKKRINIAKSGYALYKKKFSAKAVGHQLVSFMGELL